MKNSSQGLYTVVTATTPTTTIRSVYDNGQYDFITVIYTVSTSHAINFFLTVCTCTSYTRVYYIIIASYRYAVHTVIIILLYFPAVRTYYNTIGGGEALW